MDLNIENHIEYITTDSESEEDPLSALGQEVPSHGLEKQEEDDEEVCSILLDPGYDQILSFIANKPLPQDELLNIPTDAFHEVFSMLQIWDTSRMMRTCKFFYNFAKQGDPGKVWSRCFQSNRERGVMRSELSYFLGLGISHFRAAFISNSSDVPQASMVRTSYKHSEKGSILLMPPSGPKLEETTTIMFPGFISFEKEEDSKIEAFVNGRDYVSSTKGYKLLYDTKKDIVLHVSKAPLQIIDMELVEVYEDGNYIDPGVLWATKRTKNNELIRGGGKQCGLSNQSGNIFKAHVYLTGNLEAGRYNTHLLPGFYDNDAPWHVLHSMIRKRGACLRRDTLVYYLPHDFYSVLEMKAWVKEFMRYPNNKDMFAKPFLILFHYKIIGKELPDVYSLVGEAINEPNSKYPYFVQYHSNADSLEEDEYSTPDKIGYTEISTRLYYGNHAITTTHDRASLYSKSSNRLFEDVRSTAANLLYSLSRPYEQVLSGKDGMVEEFAGLKGKLEKVISEINLFSDRAVEYVKSSEEVKTPKRKKEQRKKNASGKVTSAKRKIEEELTTEEDKLAAIIKERDDLMDVYCEGLSGYMRSTREREFTDILERVERTKIAETHMEERLLELICDINAFRERCAKIRKLC